MLAPHDQQTSPRNDKPYHLLWLGAAGAALLAAFSLSGAFGENATPIQFGLLPCASVLFVLLWGERMLGSERSRTTLAWVVAGVILVMGSLLATETIVRLSYHDVTRTPDRDSWFSRRWLASHEIRINHLGFREREFSPLPMPGSIRVAIMGDSVAYGEGVQTEERFSNVLQDRLNVDGSRFEILNFGRSGASLRDHLHTLEHIVLPVRPQVVLLQWNVDDVRDGPPPRLEQPRLMPFKRLDRYLHQHSATYYLLQRWWRQVGTRDALLTASPYAGRIPDTDEALRAHVHKLSQFIRNVEASGALVQVVVFPPLVEVQGDPDRYPHRKIMDRVMSLCAEAQIDCLDLRRTFASTEPASPLWANELFIHPGVLANSMAADAIVERLARRWALALPAVPGTGTQ